jgi:tRNA nucleotidyltransferase (CCA-adding enzyme)
MSYTDEMREAYLFFLLESPIIPKRYVKNGPEYFREEDCKSFIGKNVSKTELMWIDNNSRIVSLEKRRYYDAVKYVKDFLQREQQTGIPKGLQNDLKNGFEVSLGSKNLRKSIKEAMLEMISTDEKIFYFNKKI